MKQEMQVKINRWSFLKKSSIGFLGAGILSKNIKNSMGETEQESIQISKIKEFRTLGRTGFKVSDISLGTQLLREEALLKTVLKTGINYIDTAPAYGNSEQVIGNCIKDYDRKSLFITTKYNSQGELSKETILTSFRKSLERLQTEYVDCLMLQSTQSSKTVKNENFHAVISQLKAEGRVRFSGVACHGSVWTQKPEETMEQILNTAIEDGRFDIFLLTYNFLQRDMGERILKACKEKNIGTAIMKSDPVTEYYKLVEYIGEMENPSERWINLQGKYKKYSEQASDFKKRYNLTTDQEVRDAAIKFILDNHSVDTVLITFYKFEDINNYINISGKSLSSPDKKTLKNYEETFGNFYCRHACGICESKCPNKVPVNTIMRYNHYFTAQRQEKYAMGKYADLSGGNANACKTCEGFCESACPYNIPIHGLLNVAHSNLTLV